VNVGVSGWSWPSISRGERLHARSCLAIEAVRVLVLYRVRGEGLGEALGATWQRRHPSLVHGACNPAGLFRSFAFRGAGLGGESL